MSGTYTSREANNILPLSIEKKSVSVAFKEWQFRGVTKDMGIASACCELCDQEKLRYQFQIQNKYTRSKLWVGSSCILSLMLFLQSMTIARSAALLKECGIIKDVT